MVDPVVASAPAALPYAVGSWGPELHEDLRPDDLTRLMAATPDGGWHHPLLPDGGVSDVGVG